MFEPSEQEIRQFYYLLLFSLVITGIFLLLEKSTDFSRILPPSNVVFYIKSLSGEQVWTTSVKETGPTAVNMIAINTATGEELDACPGIGPALAKAIFSEREKARFTSWEDLQNRVSGMGEYKIKILQQAGVKLDN